MTTKTILEKFLDLEDTAQERVDKAENDSSNYWYWLGKLAAYGEIIEDLGG